MHTIHRKSNGNYSSNAIKEVVGQTQNPAAAESRLEALTVLSQSILSEIESLKRESTKHALVKIDLASEVQNYESSLIRCALIRTGGNQRRAARLLNIRFTTLNAKIKRLGITASGLTADED